MNKIKVLIIDDSLVIRQVIKEILEQDSAIEVVGVAEDPYVAREWIKKLNPDVLTLDVEMPKMDGITFLANLMRLRPMPVLMLSTLTTKGADITLQALEIGAVDYIAKPDESILTELSKFKRTLIEKVKLAIQVDQKTFQLNNALNDSNFGVVHCYAGNENTHQLIALGASTGGNDAIKNILMTMPENAPAVLVTQHIPKEFSKRFAIRLDKECAMHVHEAKHGQKIKPGNVYIAPGDYHLKVVQKKDELFCALSNEEVKNRHKPSVDVMFESLIPLAKQVQAVLLTGMGKDGAQGLLKLKQHGARTIIQNQATSLVWGMPGAAHALGAETDELPLTEITQTLLSFASEQQQVNKAEK